MVLLQIVAPTYANASAEFRFSPVIIEVSAEPGDSVTRAITLTATGSSALNLRFSHADFGFDSENYSPIIIADDAEETTAFSTRGWFSIPSERIRIRPGESKTVPLRITVPDNATGTTHLGMAQFAPIPDETSGANVVQTIIKTGPLVFVSVAGGDPPKPKIKQLDLPKLLTSKKRLAPKLVVDNTGDNHFSATGTLSISGAPEKSQLKIERQVVFPNQPREFLVAPQGEKLGLSGSNLKLGKNEIELSLRIEPVGDTIKTTRTVWLIPIWLMLLMLLAAALVIALAVIAVRALRMRSEVKKQLAALREETGEAADEEEAASANDYHDLADDVEDDEIELELLTHEEAVSEVDLDEELDEDLDEELDDELDE